jgi:hypothetical protein
VDPLIGVGTLTPMHASPKNTDRFSVTGSHEDALGRARARREPAERPRQGEAKSGLFRGAVAGSRGKATRPVARSAEGGRPRRRYRVEPRRIPVLNRIAVLFPLARSEQAFWVPGPSPPGCS